ncbi:MAG TPA: hypothetical protein PLH43_07785 [Acetivibrio sp.]|uniref:hypothetical protein n=1 Tax=Acetivibrio sp. TaxID=1872092 RepID=UPI002BA460EA|nr:hypothetical protein [Acetivibrio sp.]HOM02710.1 hypothetical protein [Acetivibrio sp.]
MSKDLLLSMLEAIAEASKNQNNGNTPQYHTTNQNPNRYATRPNQRTSNNLGTGGRPRPNGRPVSEKNYGFESSPNFEGSFSSEGVGQGSLDYISPEGEPSSENSHGSEGSLRYKGNDRTLKARTLATKKSYQPASTSSDNTNFDFSEISENDILRGIILSEILSKPKSLRRGRW